MAHPLKDHSVERRNRHILNAVTIVLAIANVVVIWLTVTPRLRIIATTVGFILILVIRIGLMIVMHRRLAALVARDDTIVEWIPIEWDTKMLDFHAQLSSLSFEPVGAFRYVTADTGTVITTMVPVLSSSDGAAIVTGPSPIGILSVLTDHRLLLTNDRITVDNPNFIRQYFLNRSVGELYTEHQRAAKVLLDCGNPVVAPDGGPKATIEKLAAIHQGRGSRPNSDKRTNVVLAKKNHAFVDPELAGTPMRLMAPREDQ